jgi:hypothetical protein
MSDVVVCEVNNRAFHTPIFFEVHDVYASLLSCFYTVSGSIEVRTYERWCKIMK